MSGIHESFDKANPRKRCRVASPGRKSGVHTPTANDVTWARSAHRRRLVLPKTEAMVAIDGFRRRSAVVGFLDAGVAQLVER
jgi:hypothetical protein